MTGDKPTHCPRCISCGQVFAQIEAEELCPKCRKEGCSAEIDKAYYKRLRRLARKHKAEQRAAQEEWAALVSAGLA